MAAPIEIRPMANEAEREWCARLMASSEPWLTLGRSLEACRGLLGDVSREVYVAERQSGPSGFVILTLAGAFPGYVQSICVTPAERGAGIGAQLLAFAERRIFRESPNVFLCVSSFNERARRLYERAGYRLVGELTDYLLIGHSELLFRKSRGAWSQFVPPAS